MKKCFGDFNKSPTSDLDYTKCKHKKYDIDIFYGNLLPIESTDCPSHKQSLIKNREKGENSRRYRCFKNEEKMKDFVKEFMEENSGE